MFTRTRIRGGSGARLALVPLALAALAAAPSAADAHRPPVIIRTCEVVTAVFPRAKPPTFVTPFSRYVYRSAAPGMTLAVGRLTSIAYHVGRDGLRHAVSATPGDTCILGAGVGAALARRAAARPLVACGAIGSVSRRGMHSTFTVLTSSGPVGYRYQPRLVVGQPHAGDVAVVVYRVDADGTRRAVAVTPTFACA
jgi:hypothetical protein